MLLGTGVLSAVLVRQFPDACFPFLRTLSKKWMGLLSGIFSFTPYTIWDVGFLVLILVFLFFLIRTIVKKKSFWNFLSHVFLIVSILAFLANGGWMLNHYAPKLSEELSLEVRTYTEEELLEACDHYLRKAGHLALSIDRDEDGHALPMDLEEISVLAGSAYSGLSSEYPVFEGSSLPVKRFSLIGDYLLYNGIVGMFMPVTGEAAVPSHDPPVTIAFSMAHEAAHRLGIAAEEEANFAAFLACSTSEDLRLVYSAYYHAFSYTFSSLYRADPAKASELYSRYEEEGITLLKLDREDTRAIYDRYSSPLEEISDQINDAYLKTYSHESGIRSYGEVTDYLIAWYQQKEKSR